MGNSSSQPKEEVVSYSGLPEDIKKNIINDLLKICHKNEFEMMFPSIYELKDNKIVSTKYLIKDLLIHSKIQTSYIIHIDRFHVYIYFIQPPILA